MQPTHDIIINKSLIILIILILQIHLILGCNILPGIEGMCWIGSVINVMSWHNEYYTWYLFGCSLEVLSIGGLHSLVIDPFIESFFDVLIVATRTRPWKMLDHGKVSCTIPIGHLFGDMLPCFRFWMFCQWERREPWMLLNQPSGIANIMVLLSENVLELIFRFLDHRP